MLLVTIWTAIFERHALGQLRGDVLAGTSTCRTGTRSGSGSATPRPATSPRCATCGASAVEEQFYLIWPIVMVLLLGAPAPAGWPTSAAGCSSPPSRSPWWSRCVYHAGPIGEPRQTPDAYWWIGGRSDLQARHALPEHVHPRRRTAARLGVRAGLAAVRGDARAAAHARADLFDVFAAVGPRLARLDVLVDSSSSPSTAPTRRCSAAGCSSPAWRCSCSSPPSATAARSPAGMLGTPVLVWIGVRSYGLYLFHWPIFMIIRGVAGNPLSVREFVDRRWLPPSA